MAMIESPIFNYPDYRDFLSDRFHAIKIEKKIFSHAYATQKLDVSSSYFKNLFRKIRHISLDMLGEIAELFELSKVEEEYLLHALILQTCKGRKICALSKYRMEKLKSGS